jgi:hypothetical protein
VSQKDSTPARIEWNSKGYVMVKKRSSGQTKADSYWLVITLLLPQFFEL